MPVVPMKQILGRAFDEFLQDNPKIYDPPSLFKYVRDACKELAKAQIRGFHSERKAA